MYAIGNVDYHSLHFNENIFDLGYVTMDDIIDTIKAYLTIHRYGYGNNEDSYVHLSVALLMDICLKQLFDHVDKQVYKYLQDFYIQLI